MTDEAIKAFLANGGVIQQVAVGVSGRTEDSAFNAWGAPRKKAGRPPSPPADAPVVPEVSDDEE
jgi:hypothetical protein